MHELAVCQALVSQVEEIVRGRAGRVRTITVRIGPLSGVEPALLEQAYPLASAGTGCAEARLVIERPPIRVYCKACERDSEAAANRLLCAHCGGWRVQVVSGDELLLGSVELETDADSEPAALH